MLTSSVSRCTALERLSARPPADLRPQRVAQVLPGVLFPSIVDRLPPFKVPLLAGGFIRTERDVRAVMNAGALGVTTSAVELWGDGGV